MQTAMFMQEPKTDQRTNIHTAIYTAHSELLQIVAKTLEESQYSAHELYEIMIHKRYLRPQHFKEFQKFLRWAIREGYLDKNRIISKRNKGIRIPNRFTKEQLLTFFHTIKDPRIAVTVFLGFWSGLRIGDVATLKIEDFDFEAEVIKIIQSKKSKDRIAPFLTEGKHIIEKWIKYEGATDYLFPSYESHSMATINTPHISTKTITRGFNKVLKEANLQRTDERYAGEKRKKFTFHTLRHTFCTYHLENDVSAAFVARAAGHAKMSTTVGVYGHMAAGKMMKAFRRSFETGKKNTKTIKTETPKKETTTNNQSPILKLAEKYISGDLNEEEFRKRKEVLVEEGFN